MNSGTLRIKLEPNQGGLISGTATIDGRNVVGSTNCPDGPQPGNSFPFVMPATPVSGSGGTVTFTYRQTSSTPPSGTDRGGSSTVELNFTGLLAGDVITGTWSIPSSWKTR